MSNDSYNGWTNRETWAVALHVNNDQGWQESVHDAIREALVANGEDYSFGEVTDTDRARWAGEAIKSNVEDTLEGLDEPTPDDETVTYLRRLLAVGSDIGSLWRVNWTELGAAFLADIEELS